MHEIVISYYTSGSQNTGADDSFFFNSLSCAVKLLHGVVHKAEFTVTDL